MAVQNPHLYADPLPVTLAGSVATTAVHKSAVTSLVLIKAGLTGLYGGFISNPSTTAMAYLQCFNATQTTDVTLGTTPPQDVFHLPIQSAFGDKWSNSLIYDLGIVVAATTDLGNSTLVSTAVKVSLYVI